jgi:hypothetical protein
MLLKSYRKETFRPGCNPSFQSLHCIAHLDEDITDVFPISMRSWEDTSTPRSRRRSLSRPMGSSLPCILARLPSMP